MAQQDLEKRIAILEEQVRQLIRGSSRRVGRNDWMATVGMFEGDRHMKEIDAAGLAIREADRRRARRKPAKRRHRAKS